MVSGAGRTGVFAVEALAAAAFPELSVLAVLTFFSFLVLAPISSLDQRPKTALDQIANLLSLCHGLTLGIAGLGTDETCDHAAGLVDCPESAQKEDHLADKVQLHAGAHRELRAHDRRTDQKVQLHGHQHAVARKAGTHEEIPPLSEVLSVIQRNGCRKKRGYNIQKQQIEESSHHCDQRDQQEEGEHQTQTDENDIVELTNIEIDLHITELVRAQSAGFEKFTANGIRRSHDLASALHGIAGEVEAFIICRIQSTQNENHSSQCRISCRASCQCHGGIQARQNGLRQVDYAENRELHRKQVQHGAEKRRHYPGNRALVLKVEVQHGTGDAVDGKDDCQSQCEEIDIPEGTPHGIHVQECPQQRRFLALKDHRLHTQQRIKEIRKAVQNLQRHLRQRIQRTEKVIQDPLPEPPARRIDGFVQYRAQYIAVNEGEYRTQNTLYAIKYRADDIVQYPL